MKDMKNWLANMHSQMAQMGLTDPDKKPADVPCGTCETPITYRWVASQRHSYWCKGSCWKCREEAHQEKKKEQREKKLESAGVPVALRPNCLSLSSLFADGANSHVEMLVRDWEPPKWLMLTGPIGTGKTAWLTALFNYLVILGEGWGDAKWITEADLFHQCDSAHHHNGYTARQDAVSPYLKASILFVDDLGASRRPLTEWQGSTMRNLFDKRHSSESPTFITTNIVKIDELERRYGDHIVSRILHATGGLVYLGGPDRRKA